MQDRKGFTLIELLIVVVIIGILAAIAIPKFSATREKAYYSTLKSDLKNLATQQEIYYADGNYTYSSSVTNLGFSSSDGVNLGTITATTSGWSVTSTHSGLGTGHGCAIYYGSATAPTVPGGSAVSQAGVVECDV
ncbi:MAG: prepilin-type N-terminal cleavage/methylation domain-containing protein [Gemmatimonadetes bacterium]|nr:prepilin-type N-terminal cleavage/methylation domain-containing protein [Gemmatimonadota bacterium]